MGKTWTFNRQDEFLRSKKSAFRAAQKKGVAELALFWGDTIRDFFTLWPTPEAERADREAEEKQREEDEKRENQEGTDASKKTKKKKKKKTSTKRAEPLLEEGVWVKKRQQVCQPYT
jgi:hypothetical protein